jgi:cation transport protein ChaC
MAHGSDLWVFGYGSLMWNPGFSHVARHLATLPGYHRRFCLRSVRYRGTPEAPGLVLGLDAAAGASCDGVAYRVAAADAEPVLAYLRERELVTYAYREARIPVALRPDGATVEAVTYVVDADHDQYAGHLSIDEQAAIIATRAGPRGTNRAYLDSTMAHLRDCGIHDPDLEAVAARVQQYGA